jgi:hypothetical protein
MGRKTGRSAWRFAGWHMAQLRVVGFDKGFKRFAGAALLTL